MKQCVESDMAVVTAIEAQKNHADRVNVYLDGRFAFGASALVVAARQIRVGIGLSEADVEALQVDDSAERAFNAALNFLSFRPRSTRELEDYFRRRGVDLDIKQAVMDRLRRSHLLNDEEFARFWIENRQSFRPRGRRALRAELRQKGVDSQTIDEALDTAGDEHDNALAAGRKKAWSYRSLEGREFLVKMIAFLQRRGFAYAVAARVARDLLQERGSDSTADGLEEAFHDQLEE